MWTCCLQTAKSRTMGALSEGMEEQLDGCSSSCSAEQPLRPMERKRPTVPLVWVCPFTHRVCFCRSQDVPDRVRLTRALLQHRGLEHTCTCGSAFACECGSHPQAQERPALRDHQEALFPQAWKRSSQHPGKAIPLQGRSGSQLVSVYKPVFGRNRLGVSGQRTPVLLRGPKFHSQG